MRFDSLKLLFRLLATHIMCISISTPLILTISILSDMHIQYVSCLNLLLRFSYIIIYLLASFDKILYPLPPYTNLTLCILGANSD